MAKRQPLRQRPDRGFLSLRQSADGQEQQVLLRLEARLQRRGVAFLQEPPYAIAQLRQRPVFPVCNPCSHSFILSHHDICFHPPHFPVVVSFGPTLEPGPPLGPISGLWQTARQTPSASQPHTFLQVEVLATI